jgi:ATP-dependent Clp protease protease subunit
MPDLETFLLGETDSTFPDFFNELYADYLKNRTLVLNHDIDDGVIENYIMYILKWNKEDKNLPVDKRKKITILMSSPGGNQFSGNIMMDVIQQSKTPVVGVALDLVASACYSLFLACHERIAFKNSAFLQHEGEIALENSRTKFKQTAKFFDAMEANMKEFILSHTKMTSEFYDSIYDQEFWMDTATAKEFGVIHKIIGEDCDIDEIF